MNRRPLPFHLLARDPRHFQILALGSLLLYGVLALDLEVRALQALAMLATALLAQYAATLLTRHASTPPRWGGANGPGSKAREARTTEAYSQYVEGVRASATPETGPFPPPQPFDPRSALISGLSLCLLLRTNHLALAMLAALLAIGSKFALRWRGKHLFNPTCFGIVATMLATGQAWISPGQWGSAAYLAFLLVCLGGVVVNRAARSDVTFAFLACYLALLFGRAWWLGQPASIPLHQLGSGALLIFAFFMISDPKTTPDSRAGRVAFAALVALGAGFVQFVLYRRNGLILSLACLSLAVPVLDRLLPGKRYAWRDSPAASPDPSHLERRFA
jgi:hypothetical protein